MEATNFMQKVWPTLYLHYLYFELCSKHACQKHEREAPESRCTERSVKDCAFLCLRCPAGPLRTRYTHPCQILEVQAHAKHKPFNQKEQIKKMKNVCKSSLLCIINEEGTSMRSANGLRLIAHRSGVSSPSLGVMIFVGLM